jgi:plasmid stability protein
MALSMTTMLQVKGIPAELRERLETSAARNFRSLNQEALARIQFSFDVEDRSQASQLNQLIGQGMEGEPRAGSAARLREIAAKARG